MSKEIEDLVFPDDIRYSAEHIWVRQETEKCTLGITDFAQDQLGEIVFVELPEVEEFFQQGEIFGTLESMRTISELYMPIDGEICEVNIRLSDEPEMANQDPYNQGWIIRIKPDNSNSDKNLLTDQEYIESLHRANIGAINE